MAIAAIKLTNRHLPAVFWSNFQGRMTVISLALAHIVATQLLLDNWISNAENVMMRLVELLMHGNISIATRSWR